MVKLYNIAPPGSSEHTHEGIATKVENAVGIDLGTTNSLVAVVQNGKPVIIPIFGGGGIMPSVVRYELDNVMVGNEALNYKGNKEAVVISSVKRLMAKPMGDIARLQTHTPYELAPGDHSIISIPTPKGNQTPIQVSAQILQNLKQQAEKYLHTKVEHAVITVPAHFNEAERFATKQAAKLAGLHVLRIINEPTAAALAYGLEHMNQGTYLVFDLGGGTFDISVIRMGDGIFHVLATAGDLYLGGDDFDKAIAEHLFHDCDVENMSLARQIKEYLSAHKSWNVGNLRFDKTDLDILMKPYLKRMQKLLSRVLIDAGLSAHLIDEVIMVGGATRMNCVCSMVEQFFGKSPLTSINPDEVVAMGAALQARQLCYGGDITLLDVVPLSIGIELGGGIMEVVIPRNSPIPNEVVQRYGTMRDNQTAFVINILQGESERAVECQSLARFELSDLEARRAGEVQMEITFRVDVDGLLSVSAQVLPDGEQREIIMRAR